MPIYKGNTQIVKVYQGETEIDKVYRGASKVYGADKGTEITVSGNPLVLTNVAREKPLNTLEIMGRTEQVQLQGYNLWQPNWLPSREVQGVTITNNGDGTYTLNGTCITSVNAQYDIELSAGTYILKANCDTVPVYSSTALIQIWSFSLNNGMTVTNSDAINGTSSVTFSTDVNVVARIRLAGGVTYNNFVIKPQLEKGSVAHPYEPYCGGSPSPNPAYPQEIVNVNSLEVVQSGNNLLDTNMKVTSQNVDYSFDDDGFITVTKTITSGSGYVRGEIVLPKGTYTFSADALGEQMLISQCYAQLGSSWYLGNSIVRNPPVGMTRTFTVAEETKYNMFFAYCPASWAGTFKYRLQLEQGIEATPYEPYKPIHTVTIDGIELTKWDKIVKRNGVWGVSKWSIARKLEADDSKWTAHEKWNTWGVNNLVDGRTGFYTYRICDFDQNAQSVIEAKSSHFVRSTGVWGGNNLGFDFAWNATTLNPMSAYFSCCVLNGVLEDVSSKDKALESFKKLITNKDIFVYYKGATEQSFTPLSQTIQDQLNTLQIVKPPTVVTNDKECEMSAKYLCYLDSTEAMLTKLYHNDLSEVLK